MLPSFKYSMNGSGIRGGGGLVDGACSSSSLWMAVATISYKDQSFKKSLMLQEKYLFFKLEKLKNQ